MSTVLRRRWVRVIGVPVATAGLAVGLVACGSSAATTGSATGTGGTPSGATADADMQAFASCLAENGVTLPERGGDGGSPPSGAPSAGGAGGPGGGGTPPSGAPTPGSGQGGPDQAGGAVQAPPGVDATAWAAAQKACAQYAPTPPSGAASS